MKKLICISFVLLSVLVSGYGQSGKNYTIFKTDSRIIYDLCFTSKGGSLAIADNNTIKVFSVNSKELVSEFKNGHTSQIRAIDISKDSSLLVSGDKEGKIVLWDFKNNTILKTLTFQKGIVTSLKFSPDGKYFASGGIDNKVYLYDISNNIVLHVFTDHTDDITSVCFSPDGKLLAAASGDKTISIYDLMNNQLITTLKGHKSWVRSIAFCNDGTRLISCSDDSQVITWNVMDHDKISMLDKAKNSFNWLMTVDYNEDGKSYVFGCWSGKAKIVTPFGINYLNVGKPINKIKFKPNTDFYLVIAIATRGKGVIYADARDMKVKN